MRRRNFIIGSALSLGLAGARAQSTAGLRRLGWLMPSPPTNPPQAMQFIEALVKLGWIEGKTIQIDRRYVVGEAADRAAALEARAKEIVALSPDVIFTGTSPAVEAFRRETTTIPIVFVGVNNPLGAQFVSSLAHPGGNITGFIDMESAVVSKGLQVLTEIAPQVKRMAVMFNPRSAPFAEYYLRAVDSVAAKLRINVFAATVASEQEIERVIASLGREAGSGLMLLPEGFMSVHHKLIIALAAQHKVPAVYYASFAVAQGGLIAYGVDFIDQLRRAAVYVDQILRGARPAELPVQQPDKFELHINLKTAKSLGLTVPPSLLLRADHVIE
jgi:putative ABC transport system substrate-binding protein